ncbi:conjugal transfer protein TrbD [Salmonella enterica subsp. enterica serovar Chandans]|nr:conjugal transfer protein TrbD [Salmonella enterica]EKB3330360.1 conjugal transfer protein TrbD [Salmonella enterica subsp. enterica serovar Chandans]
MNIRNVICNVISVPGEPVQDDFVKSVISNCTTRIQLPAPKKSSPELLPCHFNMAAAGVMKKGMSMNMFSSPGNTVFIGQPGAGKTKPPVGLMPDVTGIYKKGEES